jgi:nucleoid-associated protein YgaU
MGRETKLLLGLLATLLGVFVGVLSMKLLVPRPPAGAGPDIQSDVASTEPQDLVEPPRFTADPLPPTTTVTPPSNEPRGRSRFAGVPSASAVAPAASDPFVARASYEEPAAAPYPPRPQPVASRVSATGLDEQRPAAPPPMPGSSYVARPGDSWWSLAEQVYGDGRLYRAVFAWNRALDPRVSLVAGTPIELPPRDRLETAWPALMPTPAGTTQATP